VLTIPNCGQLREVQFKVKVLKVKVSHKKILLTPKQGYGHWLLDYVGDFEVNVCLSWQFVWGNDTQFSSREFAT